MPAGYYFFGAHHNTWYFSTYTNLLILFDVWFAFACFVWCLIHTDKYCTLSRLPAIFLVNGWNGICVNIISVWGGFRLSHFPAQNESQKVAGRAAGSAERAVMFSSKLCLNLSFGFFCSQTEQLPKQPVGIYGCINGIGESYWRFLRALMYVRQFYWRGLFSCVIVIDLHYICSKLSASNPARQVGSFDSMLIDERKWLLSSSDCLARRDAENGRFRVGAFTISRNASRNFHIFQPCISKKSRGDPSSIRRCSRRSRYCSL